MEERKESIYVTQLELYKYGDTMKKELREEIQVVTKDVKDLKELVLPMTGFLQGIERNTSELNLTMKEFAREQKTHTEKLHGHDLAINELQRDDDVKLEKEKGKWQFLTILGGGLLGAGGVVTVFKDQITQLATWIFGGH